MAENNTIIFRMGEETGIVVENTQEQFEQSLFKEQYRQALTLINSIITGSKDADKDAPMSNIVAFCGDRGEGKTSAMMTIRNILIGGDSFEVAKNTELFPSDNKIEKNSFKVLRLIDPAFFDNKHNLLELLLGQMYADVREADKDCKPEEMYSGNFNKNIADRNTLMTKFQDVKRSLAIIHKASDKNAYDSLEEIDELAAGIELKEDVNKLMLCYAKYFGKDRVLISIDDLDLNVTEGYLMAEEIRKYLSSPEACIVLMSIKVEQMIEVVQSYLRESMSQIIPNDTIKEMAIKYVAKMLPTQNRVNMPNGLGIVELRLVIKDNSNEESFDSVKEAVVRLIYRKTRYIFVNGRNVSPIVPTNLRSLRYLVNLLWTLPDAKKENNADNIENKLIFKNYFYKTWIRLLEVDDAKFAVTLVNNPDITTLNKSVVMHLRDLALPARNQTNQDELLVAILNPQNQVQNISVGDVFYVINQIESINTDIRKSYLLFFLKAFYSIELYETYDRISSNLKSLFVKPAKCLPKEEKEQKQEKENNGKPFIYKYDSQLQELNLLQRLLNGAYFTYPKNSLIPSELGGKERDIRLIDGKNLRVAFDKIKDSKIKEEERLVYLHLCEFFALTTIRAAKYDDKLILNRNQSGRAYFDTYSSSNNYFVFDVLSIFYNVVNIQFTYNRWDRIFKDDFFAYAYQNENSLLRQTLKLCDRKYKTPDSTLPQNIHHFISDSVIRFSEVMLSILDNAENQRDVNSEGGNANNLRKFYDNIRRIEITLYPLDPSDKKDKGYKLQFLFLEKIINLLKEIADVDNKLKKEGNDGKEEISDVERLLANQFSSIYVVSAECVSTPTPNTPLDLDYIFRDSLARRRVRYPKSKNDIINLLKRYSSKLYNANTEMWLQIIDNKIYASWDELRDELNQNRDQIINLYQGIKD